MESVTATLILDCHNQLGEGVLYDDRNHAVIWTDIYSSQFHMLHLKEDDGKSEGSLGGKHTVYPLPKKLCSFGMLDLQSITSSEASVNSLPLLCAWEDGFQLYDVVQNVALVHEMSAGEDVNPLKGPTRLNDGRVDPTGRRYICGGYYGDVPGNEMKVFKVEQQDAAAATAPSASLLALVHEPIVQTIRVTNSICWSPNGDIMYLADSPTKHIQRFDYNRETGTLANGKVLHSKPSDQNGVPDGSCVDADGFVWNAVWMPGAATGSRVERIDPSTGQVVYSVHMPDTTSQVTCCCFGGKHLDVLYITSAAVDTNAVVEPHAGGLYAARVPFQGRLESRLQWTLPSK